MAEGNGYAAAMKSVGLIALVLLTAAAAPGPHSVTRTTAALEFSYEWPAEAVAIPALDLKLYSEAKAKLAEAQKNAAEDQALARKQKREFHQHDFSGSWETAGQTPRLLSLQGGFGGYEGGAHPNGFSRALLWDRAQGRQVSVGSLFARTGDFVSLTRSIYCRMLDAERKEKREGETLGGEFDQCPKYSELTIVPADGNNNGRFDTIDIIADAYVAGPYVEGDYDVEVPVTSALIAALKPDYRASFEAQRQ